MTGEVWMDVEQAALLVWLQETIWMNFKGDYTVNKEEPTWKVVTDITVMFTTEQSALYNKN